MCTFVHVKRPSGWRVTQWAKTPLAVPRLLATLMHGSSVLMASMRMLAQGLFQQGR